MTVRTPEWALVKKRQRGKALDEFDRFESLVSGSFCFNQGRALLKITQPLNCLSTLSSGNTFSISYCLPGYFLLKMDVEDADLTILGAGVKADVLEGVDKRYCRVATILGRSERSLPRRALRTPQLRGGPNGIKGWLKPVHALSWVLDARLRWTVSRLFGQATVSAIDDTFTESQLDEALLNYVGGKRSTMFLALKSELGNYRARGEGYTELWLAAEEAARLEAPFIASEDGWADLSKSQQFAKLCTRLDDCGDGRNPWEVVKNKAQGGNERIYACAGMALDVLGIRPTAVPVEVANKKHSEIHTLRRSSLSDSRLVKALYIYANCALSRHDPDARRMRLKDVVSNTLSVEEAEEVLDKLEADENLATRLPQERVGGIGGAEDSSDEEEEIVDATDEKYAVPSGFCALTGARKPAGLLTELEGLWVLMLWQHEGGGTAWYAGMVKKELRGGQHNFDLLWETESLVRGSMLSMDHYYTPPGPLDDEPPQPAVGTWVYMRKESMM